MYQNNFNILVVIDLRLYTVGLIAIVVLLPIISPILNRIFLNMWEPNKIFRKKSKTFVKENISHLMKKKFLK